MASKYIKGITISIGADTQKLTKALEGVNKQSRELQGELRQVERLLKLDPTNTELLEQKQKLLAKSIETTKEKLDTLKEAERQVQAQFEKGEIGEEQYRAIQREVIATEQNLQKLEQRSKETNNYWKTAAENLNKFGQKATDIGKSMTTKITLPVLGAGAAAVKASIDFEDAFAGVRKTVDATETQLEQLSKGIQDMSKEIPASATAIAEVAEAAGQLGIETDNILSFTRVMIDLSEATNLTAEEAASSLAQFANITQMSQKEFDRLGSTIVALGNNLATTEADIVSMGMRLAGAGKQIGLTEAQIMSFAGALSSVGIEAEAGGSAFSRVMVDMQLAVETNSKRLNDFAKVAGMSAQEFKKAFKEDAASAIIAFIQGLGSAEKRGISAIKVLDDMGITEIRLRDALLRAAGASDVFTNAIELGNRAWDENNALTKEAEQRYQTTASQIEIAKNHLTDAGITIGNALVPHLVDLAEKVKEVADWFSNLNPATQETIVKIAGIVAAIGPLLLIGGKLATAISSIIKVTKTVTTVIGPLVTGVKAAITGFSGMSGIITIVKGALTALIGPVGIAVAAIAGIAAITALVIKNWDKVKEFFAGLGDWFKNTFTNIANSMVQFGKNIIQGLYNGIMSNVKSIYNSITSIGNTIINTFKRLLGISSPSKVMQEYGEYIDEGLVKGIKMGEGSVKDQVQRLADGIKQTMEKNIDMLDKFGNALVDALRKQYEEMEDIQLKALDKQIENERKASNERIAIYDKEYAEKLKLIDEEAYKQIQALQEQIDAIDRQTEEEEKALREQEHQARVAELQKQLAAAETAEERQRIQEELTETIADYERELLLEQREEMKEQLRAQIEEIRNAAEEKKAALEEELEAKKEIEQQKLDAVIASLEDEKAAIQEHYEELMTEENLQAEARKLIIEKNNDEIIRLLETYNPKWQDAGQSFAESLIYGLNSEKQSMEETVAEMLNLEPTIDKQIQALDKLEQKLATLGDSSSSGGGGGGGLSDLQIPAIEEITEDFNNLEQAADGASKSINNIIANLDNSYNAVNLFGDGISENTQKAVSGFLELDNQATIVLNTLSWSGQTITAETKDAIVNNFAQMKNQVITELDTQKENGLAILGEFLAGSENISQEEREILLQNVSEGYEERKQKIEENEARIKEILTTASNEKRALTEEEKEEINRLQNEMRNEGIRILSENEVEAKIILERMKAQAGEITARQAAEVVQNSLYQKEEAIKQAEEQYDKVIAEIIKQRDEVGSITAEQADELIKEAKRQRDEAIAKAEEMHNKVVEEAKKQAGEHANEVDWETGEILSKWDMFKRNVGQKVTEIKENAIETWQNMWNEIKNKVENAWEYMSDAFSGLWDSISDWFEDLIDDAFDWGKNLIDGFIDGIKSMISKVKQAASSVTNAVSDFLGFHSPAKKGEGRHIVEWGYNMIEGFMEGMQKALPELQMSAKAVVPVIKNEIINTTQIDYSKIPKGDTIINVYNPQPSPSELARQIKKTQQELALGF